MSDTIKREWRFYIDSDTLWSIIRDDVPELISLLEALKIEE